MCVCCIWFAVRGGDCCEEGLGFCEVFDSSPRLKVGPLRYCLVMCAMDEWGGELVGGVRVDVVLVEELCCAGVHRRRFFLAWVMRGCALFAKLTAYLKRAILIIV